MFDGLVATCLSGVHHIGKILLHVTKENNELTMNDSDEDKNTDNQLEKILIKSEPDLLVFCKSYSLLGALIETKFRHRLIRLLVYHYYYYCYC
ncbi:MAG: hypothetical protein DLM72_00430 [Candidatus Nitrosopolaris wilkensis]|nr:MAG: hypothetical protein DLM72_00430 [Candidatus Nitrosopolaris wilkensis]